MVNTITHRPITAHGHGDDRSSPCPRLRRSDLHDETYRCGGAKDNCEQQA